MGRWVGRGALQAQGEGGICMHHAVRHCTCQHATCLSPGQLNLPYCSFPRAAEGTGVRAGPEQLLSRPLKTLGAMPQSQTASYWHGHSDPLPLYVLHADTSLFCCPASPLSQHCIQIYLYPTTFLYSLHADDQHLLGL